MTMAEERPPDPLFAGAPPDDDLDYYLSEMAEEIDRATYTISDPAVPPAGFEGVVVDLGLVRAARSAEDEQADREDVGRRFASDYFAQVGEGGKTQRVFLVRTLAEDIMAESPLAVGIDDRVWSYEGGVWKPTKSVVRGRATRLLQERYKSDMANNAEHIIRFELEAAGRIITGAPVKEVINFRNGYLYWATGTLQPHDPSVLSTVQLATEWDPDATCPEFDKFLAMVVPPDMIDMVWELIGYLMFSGNPLQKAVMLHGTGRNGKGTLLRVILNLLGQENVTAISLQALATERFAPANLFNKLANIAGDIDGTYMENTAKFKGITGEDSISAELKGRDHFEFTPWAVPMFSANKIPGSADVTTGYMARWVVVPFPHDFTGREDRGLDSRIGTPQEIRGVAAKAVIALRRLMDRGNFTEPDSARVAMDDFRKKVDQVRTWLDERAELHDDYPAVSRTTLYNDYKNWARDGGYGQLRASEFYERLVSIGVQAKKVQGERMHAGLRLIPLPSQGW